MRGSPAGPKLGEDWLDRFVFPDCDSFLATVNAYYLGTHDMPSIQAMDCSYELAQWRAGANKRRYRKAHGYILELERRASELVNSGLSFHDSIMNAGAVMEAERGRMGKCGKELPFKSYRDSFQ